MPIDIGNIRLFSVLELSEKLRCAPGTIREYLREGRLKGRKVGVKWYVSEESLREYFSTSNNQSIIEKKAT